MTRQRWARLVWTLAAACLLLQLAALRTGWLNAFFFDTTAPNTQGVDFFPLPRAFSNLVAGRSIFDTFHSTYGPYATWFIYHPAFTFLAAPLLLFTPWTAYAIWTALSAALMLASAVLLWRQGSDPLRRALVGLLLLGSFPGFLMLYCGNAQSLLVFAIALIFVAVDRLRQCTRSEAAEERTGRRAQSMLLIGLLLSLFSKPVVFVMLPLLLLVPETRRTALRALLLYALVSTAFLAVPALNPVFMPWSQRAFLLMHLSVVANTMNPWANGLDITAPMQDNVMHWLVMLGLNSFHFMHVDAYSLPALLDGWSGTRTPDALYRVPLLLLLEVSVLVAFVRSASCRLEAAQFTLMAAAVLVLVSYGLVWEYHFTLLLPIAAMLLLSTRLGWLERTVIAFAWFTWLPSLYVLLRHDDLAKPGTLGLLHAERVLPAAAAFCLLLFRAAQLALRSPEGLGFRRKQSAQKAVSC